MAEKFKSGNIVEFTGYAGEAPEPAILVAGDKLELLSEKEQGNDKYWEAKLLGRENEDGTEIVETIYPDEFKIAAETVEGGEAEVVTGEAKLEEAPKAKKTATKKAKAEPKQEVAVVEEAPAPKASKKNTERAEIELTTAADLAGADALEQVRVLIRRQHTTNFRIGHLLSEIRTEKQYERLGYEGRDGFKNYAEKELGDIGGYRKAMYLVEIYDTFSANGITEEQFERLGSWAKAVELCRLKDAGSMVEMLNMAVEQNLTREDLKSEVSKRILAEGGEEAVRHSYSTMKFRVTQDQGEIIQRTVEHFKAMDGLDSDMDGQGLANACSFAMSTVTQEAQTTLAQQIERLQSIYGVKLKVETASASEVRATENEEATA